MLQRGIIEEISCGMAKVKITRSSACGENCAECGLCPGQSAVVEALNDARADIGDTVTISMSDKKVLGAAFLVYIVPLFTLVAGYFAGEALFKNETAAVFTGLFVMALTFGIIISFDKRLKHRYTPRVVEIINAKGERV